MQFHCTMLNDDIIGILFAKRSDPKGLDINEETVITTF